MTWENVSLLCVFLHPWLFEINISTESSVLRDTSHSLDFSLSSTNTHTQTFPHHISLSSSSFHIPHFCSNWNCKLDLVWPDFCKNVPQDVFEIFCTTVRGLLLTIIQASDYEGNFPHSDATSIQRGSHLVQTWTSFVHWRADQMHHCHILWLRAIYLYLALS